MEEGKKGGREGEGKILTQSSTPAEHPSYREMVENVSNMLSPNQNWEEEEEEEGKCVLWSRWGELDTASPTRKRIIIITSDCNFHGIHGISSHHAPSIKSDYRREKILSIFSIFSMRMHHLQGITPARGSPPVVVHRLDRHGLKRCHPRTLRKRQRATMKQFTPWTDSRI